MTVLWASLVSIVVSAIVSGCVTYYFKKREIRFGLLAAYEHEQQREIRALIGRYHGRLLRTTFSLHGRMQNLYRNQDRGWLEIGGDFGRCGYYFESMVYRYLSVFALVRQFELEAIYLDARLARPEDFTFMNYLSALSLCATQVELFGELPYDVSHCTDHFYADSLRSWAESMCSDGELQSFDAFRQRIPLDSAALSALLAFFDGLRRGEGRLRWDRLVALDLVLMAFINRFGYPTQQSSVEEFKRACNQIEHQDVLTGLVRLLRTAGLDQDEEAKCIVHAVDASVRFSA